MNDSQKALVARVLNQLDKSFENMTMQERADVANYLHNSLQRKIVGRHNFAEAVKQQKHDIDEADKSQALYKKRKSLYDEDLKRAENAKRAAEAKRIKDEEEKAAQLLKDQEVAANPEPQIPTDTTSDSAP